MNDIVQRAERKMNSGTLTIARGEHTHFSK